MSRTNLHATAVIVGRTGLLITGPSSAGKSRLALALIDLFRAKRVFASLVADDQVWARVSQGRLIVEAPAPTSGLVEIRGFGPAPISFESRTVIDAVIALVEPASVPRYRNDASETVAGVDLPLLNVARGDVLGAASAIAAWVDFLGNA